MANGVLAISVDLKPALKSLGAQLAAFSDEVQKTALARALNRVSGPVFTGFRRDLVAQTGMLYGKVREQTVMRRAHRFQKDLEVRFDVSGKATRVSDFATRLKPGKKNPSAKPWNTPRVFKNSFVIRYRDGNTTIVSRHGASGGRPLKILSGPILAHEILRTDKPTARNVAASIPERLIPEVISQLSFAAQQAAARGGK